MLRLCQFSKLLCLILLINIFYSDKIPVNADENNSLAQLVKRCHYYHIRSRAGDPSARYLLISKDTNGDNLTGLEKCINVIKQYLEDPNITTQERKVYEQVKINLSSLLDKLPEESNTENQPSPTN